MTEVLALSGVDALYGESHVLHGVSFSLNPGRVLALLGRNGAGKTTCMSAIIGFLPPRTGEIRLFGEAIGRLSPETISRKGVGFVPQGRRIFPSLTVQENLVVSRQKRKGVAMPWTLERVIELFPRLKERLQQSAGSLSGGEQQMLAIGRALMARPKLLLLDEPSLGIGPILVQRIYETIGEINRSGVAILLVEQNANRALDAASRGYVLETGRVALASDSASLQNDPGVQKAYLGT